MTTQQVHLVKRSWSVLQKIEPVIVADVFYTKLFADKPSLRVLFPASMDEQYRKLIEMINILIARLDRPGAFEEEMEAMANRHITYGVKEKHYILVGNALLWTLEKGLGKDWTADVKEAWMACYNQLATVMRAAKKQALRPDLAAGRS